MVKLHARYNGVRVMSARVIHNCFDDDIVGCKISVPDDEVRIGNNNGHDSYSYTGRQQNEGAY